MVLVARMDGDDVMHRDRLGAQSDALLNDAGLAAAVQEIRQSANVREARTANVS